MRCCLIIALVICPVPFLMLSSAHGEPSSVYADESVCSFDRDALLALDQHAFDQDMDGGWRAIAQRGGRCIEVAADLIREYRETHGLEAVILYWHEGQLRAEAGQAEAAIGLFEKSRWATDDPFGWNLYVDATIAFMEDDKAALLAARDALARLPRPTDFQPRDQSGNPVDLPWPPNLSVVDMLVACFGQPYKEAYGRCEQ